MQLSPSQLPRDFGTLPVRAALESDLAALVAQFAPVPEVEAAPDGLLLATLRANLQAAARHTTLGHAGPSFRECARPACIEAARLIPDLDPIQGAATDAELDAILEEVLTSLEREGTSFLVSKPS